MATTLETQRALSLLDECLYDEHRLWTGDELLELLEEVYVTLGGSLPLVDVAPLRVS